MTETIRVVWVAAPYKFHSYQSVARYFPTNVELRVVSAVLGYNGKIPIFSRLKRYNNGIWFLPRRELIRQFIEFQPDIVFTDYPAYPSWYAKLYAHLRGERVPLVVWLLGDYWTEYFAYLRGLTLRERPTGAVYLFSWVTGMKLADQILTVCDWLREKAVKRLPTKRISVQYAGVDPEPWLARESRLYDFKHPAVGILQDNNILPKVNGLIWFAQVIKKMPEVNFYVAGGGRYTPLVEKAFSGLANAHLEGRVPFPDGVRAFYRSCDVYALPSGLDCAPVTLLEASLNSLPVVASRVGGIPELVEEGKTGWTLPNGNADLWVERIRTLLSDSDLASSIGAKAKEHVLANFTWRTQCQSLTRKFQEQLAR